MADRPNLLAPQLWLLLMNLIWGVSFASVKIVVEHGVPVFVLLSVRFWIAVLCLLPFALRAGLGRLKSEAGRGVWTGVALLAGYLLQTFGMQRTTASMAGFLSGLITLIVALAGWLVFRERLRRADALGLLLGLCGLMLLCLGMPVAADGGGSSLLGVALQVGASCCYALHILMLSRLSRPGGEQAYCWWQLTTVALGVTALLPLADGEAAPWGLDSGIVWANLAYLGIFALAVAILVQSKVQPRIPAIRVAVIFASQPLFAALAGNLMMQDALRTGEWLGGGLITGGVLLAALARPRAKAA